MKTRKTKKNREIPIKKTKKKKEEEKKTRKTKRRKKKKKRNKTIGPNLGQVILVLVLVGLD